MELNKNLLNYVVVEKNDISPSSLQVVSTVYDAWYSVWSDVFSSEKRNFKPQADDFVRQDLVAGIFYEKSLVGFHLYSFFDLRKKQNQLHSYFTKIEPTSFDLLQKKNLQTVMSMEYLTVMPDFRKKESPIPWGEVIISLGQKILQSSQLDMAFGTARRDVKVDKMGERLGWNRLQDPILKYDYECEVLYFPRTQESRHPDPNVEALIGQLWQTRTDSRFSNVRHLKVA